MVCGNTFRFGDFASQWLDREVELTPRGATFLTFRSAFGRWAWPLGLVPVGGRAVIVVKPAPLPRIVAARTRLRSE